MKSITNKNGKKKQKANARKHKLAEQANDDDQSPAENEVKMVQPKPEVKDDGNNAKNKEGGGNNHMELESLTLAEEGEECTNNKQRRKVQLPLENWVDSFGFVPRRQLVKLLPQIDDRQFAEAIQYFLLKCGKITIASDYFRIIPPVENDVNGRPIVRVEKGGRWTRQRLCLPDTPMPGNIKNFGSILLSYFDISVLDFLKKFQQNSLLENVHLGLTFIPEEKLRSFLSHVLPLIGSIKSIDIGDIRQLNEIYKASAKNSSYEFSQMLKTMMAQATILEISTNGQRLKPEELDWCCQWLYGTPRADGQPRVLQLQLFIYVRDSTGISSIIERIKKDFLIANHPCKFFICIDVSGIFTWEGDISLQNLRTKEELVAKSVSQQWRERLFNDEQFILISRLPSGAVEANEEKEVLGWKFSEKSKRILLDRIDFKVDI